MLQLGDFASGNGICIFAIMQINISVEARHQFFIADAIGGCEEASGRNYGNVSVGHRAIFS